MYKCVCFYFFHLSKTHWYASGRYQTNTVRVLIRFQCFYELHTDTNGVNVSWNMSLICTTVTALMTNKSVEKASAVFAKWKRNLRVTSRLLLYISQKYLLYSPFNIYIYFTTFSSVPFMAFSTLQAQLFYQCNDLLFSENIFIFCLTIQVVVMYWQVRFLQLLI